MIRRGELRALTGARGVAAWFVVLFHIRLSIAGLPASLGRIFAKGYLAVDLFFLLSGFVIWLSWGERLHRERWRAVGPFLLKRIARIWPLHAVMLGATVTLALALAATGRADPVRFPFAALPLHVLLLQNWGFTDQLAWNVPSWSISAELGAYLLFPVLAVAIDWRRLLTVALLALVALLLVGLCFAFAHSPLLSFDIPHTGLLRCLIEFTTGTLLCALWRRNPPVRPIALTALVMGGLWALGMPETFAAPALFACLLLLLAETGSRPALLGAPLPHWLGEISYATYLCHYPLWIVFKLLFVRDATAVPLAAIVAYLALVLVASSLLYRWIERPGQHWIMGLWGGTASAIPPRAAINPPLRPPALPRAPR